MSLQCVYMNASMCEYLTQTHHRRSAFLKELIWAEPLAQ